MEKSKSTWQKNLTLSYTKNINYPFNNSIYNNNYLQYKSRSFEPKNNFSSLVKIDKMFNGFKNNILYNQNKSKINHDFSQNEPKIQKDINQNINISVKSNIWINKSGSNLNYDNKSECQNFIEKKDNLNNFGLDQSFESEFIQKPINNYEYLNLELLDSSFDKPYSAYSIPNSKFIYLKKNDTSLKSSLSSYSYSTDRSSKKNKMFENEQNEWESNEIYRFNKNGDEKTFEEEIILFNDDNDDNDITTISDEEYSIKENININIDYSKLETIQYDRKTGKQLIPPLNKSLFYNVPPTINFVTQENNLTEIPIQLKKFFKWKISSITPNIVKSIIQKAGFRLTTHRTKWVGTWSRHMKPDGFRSIREYQKINHFPGSFQLGRKDRLCRNLNHAQAVHGKTEYDFVPQTFVLPSDYNLLKNEIESSNKNEKWIVKPPASARGQGIKVINKLESIHKKKAAVVQKYISNPYLINGHKFDLRIYVYVTSFDPLRIYLFNDGLARFATKKYSNSSKSIKDKYIHLTNYSINKNNANYKENNNDDDLNGHKWSLKALFSFMNRQGIDTQKIWEKIKDLVIKTIIVADPYINVLVKGYVRRKWCVHELFGFDIILDESLKPWIIEVNISPSLHSTSPLDIAVKEKMIVDLLNLAGFMIPNSNDYSRIEENKKKPDTIVPKYFTQNLAILPQQLSNDEKLKHQFYVSHYEDEKLRKTLFNNVTPDDLRILIEYEDELSRRGDFSCIFPTNDSKKYLRFFENNRYYNIMLIEWIIKFENNKEKGIKLLNNYCSKNVHTQNPSIYSENQWSQNKIDSSQNKVK